MDFLSSSLDYYYYNYCTSSQVKSKIPQCYLVGFPNLGLTCFLNSALQAFKPAFLLILQQLHPAPSFSRGSILEALFNLYDAEKATEHINHLLDLLLKEPYFIEGTNLQYIKMDDTLNVLNQLLYVIKKEEDMQGLKIFYQNFVLQQNQEVCKKCGLVLNVKLSHYHPILSAGSIQKALEIKLQNFSICPKCETKRENETQLPNFLVLRCNKHQNTILEKEIKLKSGQYILLSFLVSSYSHATAFVLYDDKFYVFDDDRKPDLRKLSENKVQSMNILGAIYCKFSFYSSCLNILNNTGISSTNNSTMNLFDSDIPTSGISSNISTSDISIFSRSTDIFTSKTRIIATGISYPSLYHNFVFAIKPSKFNPAALVSSLQALKPSFIISMFKEKIETFSYAKTSTIHYLKCIYQNQNNIIDFLLKKLLKVEQFEKQKLFDTMAVLIQLVEDFKNEEKRLYDNYAIVKKGYCEKCKKSFQKDYSYLMVVENTVDEFLSRWTQKPINCAACNLPQVIKVFNSDYLIIECQNVKTVPLEVDWIQEKYKLLSCILKPSQYSQFSIATVRYLDENNNDVIFRFSENSFQVEKEFFLKMDIVRGLIYQKIEKEQ